MLFCACLHSRAPRGARGLKFKTWIDSDGVTGRAPRGARGLKFRRHHAEEQEYESRPSRGAWIEMLLPLSPFAQFFGRAPRGARGLKYRKNRLHEKLSSRAPRGARGLKLLSFVATSDEEASRAPRGARGLK